MALLLGAAMEKNGAWVRGGTRVLGVVAALAAAACFFLLFTVRNVPAPGDIASALSHHPGAYTLSLGHMEDLTIESFAYLRLPLALGGAVLPGHAAGEPFTDPQHALQVTNGRTPAFPGLEVSPGDLLECDFLQLSIGQKALEGGVFTFEVLEAFGVLGLQPTELVTPSVIGGLGDIQFTANRRGALAIGSGRNPKPCLLTVGVSFG